MQAHFWIGDERIPAPRYRIGDPVVHKVDELNRPGTEWYIKHEPHDSLISWWYRGIVIGIEWNCGIEAGDTWRDSGWIYKIRVVETDEPQPLNAGIMAFSEFQESELKPSRVTFRRYCHNRFRNLLKVSLATSATFPRLP